MYTVYVRALNGSCINVDHIIQLYAAEYDNEEYIMAMSTYETADPILEYTSNPDQLISNALSIIANAKIQSESFGDVVIVNLEEELVQS